uniref:Putative basic tail protein n=1 Tax=Amblyomma cajennense TaxID=34607 RepID=A0A023FSV1_AMBCJ
MLALLLLGVLALNVPHTLAESVIGCPPKKATEEPVPSCNYYCGQTDGGVWKMGYYVNGTTCQYGDDTGLCAEISGVGVGCFDKNDEEVLKFLQDIGLKKPTKGTKRPRNPGNQRKQRKPSHRRRKSHKKNLSGR